MTTPTTAELRAWAREQGMDVGDRGRLSPEVRAAWDAAHVGSATATGTPAEKAAGKPAKRAGTPAKKVGRATKVAAATSSGRTTAATDRPVKKAAPVRRAAAPQTAPGERTAEPALEPESGPPAPEAQGPEPAGTGVDDVLLKDGPRVDDLERKLSELARRVAQLERAAAAPPPRRGFRRRG